MRFLLALVAALVATNSFFGPPSSVVRADGSDLIPSESELNSTLAPFTVSNYKAGPGKDGWDGNAEFDIAGSPKGSIHGRSTHRSCQARRAQPAFCRRSSNNFGMGPGRAASWAISARPAMS